MTGSANHGVWQIVETARAIRRARCKPRRQFLRQLPAFHQATQVRAMILIQIIAVLIAIAATSATVAVLKLSAREPLRLTKSEVGYCIAAVVIIAALLMAGPSVH